MSKLQCVTISIETVRCAFRTDIITAKAGTGQGDVNAIPVERIVRHLLFNAIQHGTPAVIRAPPSQFEVNTLENRLPESFRMLRNPAARSSSTTMSHSAAARSCDGRLRDLFLIRSVSFVCRSESRRRCSVATMPEAGPILRCARGPSPPCIHRWWGRELASMTLWLRRIHMFDPKRKGEGRILPLFHRETGRSRFHSRSFPLGPRTHVSGNRRVS